MCLDGGLRDRSYILGMGGLKVESDNYTHFDLCIVKIEFLFNHHFQNCCVSAFITCVYLDVVSLRQPSVIINVFSLILFSQNP